MSAITQHSTSQALQRALESQPGEKGGKWSANDEAATMGGVIDFLQKYMKRGGKIEVDGKEKMKGQAARLALTALDFANNCGGLTLSFHMDKVAAARCVTIDSKDDEQLLASHYTNSHEYLVIFFVFVFLIFTKYFLFVTSEWKRAGFPVNFHSDVINAEIHILLYLLTRRRGMISGI